MLQELLEGNETFFAQRLPGYRVHEIEIFCWICGRWGKLVAGRVSRPQHSNGGTHRGGMERPKPRSNDMYRKADEDDKKI